MQSTLLTTAIRKVCLLSLLLTGYFAANASHIMGSDIQYKCLGNDSFRFTMKIYRDCSGVQLGNTVSLSVRCRNGSGNLTLTLSRDSCTDITPICKTAKSFCSGGTFIPGSEECVYSGILYLGNQTCDEWDISWTDCCRNGAITTGAANQGFYTSTYLRKGLSPCNNSPSFENKPVAILCTGNEYILNQGVSEEDQDSLVYSFTCPKQSATQNTDWVPPYGCTYQYSTSPPRRILLDSTDGDITSKPAMQQTTIMAIKVEEYRTINGVRTKVGEVIRDMQIIIVDCKKNNNPVLQGPYLKTVCAGETVCFDILSRDVNRTDTVTLEWNRSLKNATWSTTNGLEREAKGSLCWATSEEDASSVPYSFVVTAKDNHCEIPGVTSKAYRIMVNPKPKATYNITPEPCGQFSFDASPDGTYINPQFSWRMDGKTYSSARVTHKFPRAGRYPVRLSIEANACVRHYFDTVTVDTIVEAILPADTLLCKGSPIKISGQIFNGKAPFHYSWNTGNPSDTTNTLEIIADTTAFYIWSVFDANGCTSTDTIRIGVQPPPIVELGADKRLCSGDSVLLTAAGDTLLRQYSWLSPDGVRIGPAIFARTEGTYLVIVEDSLGCTNQDSLYVHVNPPLNPLPIADWKGCYGDTISITTALADIYEWKSLIYPNEPVYSTSRRLNLTATRNDLITLTLSQTTGGVTCSYQDTFAVEIFSLPVIDLSGQKITVCEDQTSVPLLNPAPFITANGDSYTYQWHSSIPGLINNGLLQIAGVVKFGTYYIHIQIENNHGCRTLDSLLLEVRQKPAANAGPDLSLCANANELDLNKYAGVSILYQPEWQGPGVSLQNGSYIFNARNFPKGAECELHLLITEPLYGCQNKDTLLITVNPLPDVEAGTLPRLCENAERILLSQGGASPAGGEWKGPGVFLNTLNGQYEFDPSVAGSQVNGHWLYYTVISNNCSNTDSVQVFVDPVPQPQIRLLNPADSLVCITQPAITLEEINHPFENKNWSGKAVTGNGAQASFDPSLAGVGWHPVMVSVTNTMGCTHTDTLIIQVVRPPEVSLIPAGSICENQPSTIRASMKDADSVRWTINGDGVILSQNDSTLVYLNGEQDLQNGSISIQIAVWKAGPCPVITDQQVINVIRKPAFSVQVSPNNGCQPLYSNFLLTTNPGNTVNWDFDDPFSGAANTGSGNSITHLFVRSGAYQVKVRVTNPQSCDSTAIIPIQVYERPHAQFLVKPAYATVALPRINFLNASERTGNHPSFEWDFGDGSPLGTARDETHFYPDKDTGRYQARLKVTNEYGCSDDTAAWIEIGPDITVFIPNAFTPDGKVEDKLARNNRFYITADGATDFEITLFNRWGEQLYQSKDLHEGWDGTFRGEPCQMDVYIYVVSVRSYAGKHYKYYGTVTLLR